MAEGKSFGAGLIVIGVTRRVGDAPFLGETVANILQGWTGALILVVSGAASGTAKPEDNN